MKFLKNTSKCALLVLATTFVSTGLVLVWGASSLVVAMKEIEEYNNK